ncbi:MAG TPA: efflux RND transporter periplasmic adaptor subunit [Rhizomicrobium sp.]|nr:efflux RND transporter periplasmic adaptor subunit [Rhizomicrobium sp.]
MGVALAVALVWAAVQFFSGPATPPQFAPPVKAVAAVRTNVTVVEHTLGTVVANATVQVTARVDGQMMSTGFKEGDIVHSGQILFRLDPRPFIAALEQAKAALAKDQAMLLSAQNDRKRYDTLFKAGAASSQQRDQADATAKGLVATVQSDRAAVDVAKLNLAYSQIHSPIDGKTGPILVQPGNLVVANGSAPLVTITQIQPVKVSFSLPQSDLPRIQERQRQGKLTASIDTHATGGKPMIAAVDFVGNAVSNTTGTIELRATFANTDLSLVPGQLIDVSVALNNLRGAIVVPREAVNVGPDGRYVYVVGKDNNADLRPVQVLFDNGATMAISGNLKAGDKVITDGQLRVVPGKPVTVQASSGAARKAP